MYRLAFLALCISYCNADPLQCTIFGQTVAPGGRVTSGSFVYECNAGGRGGYHIVACLEDTTDGGTGAEHAIGQRWEVGKERPFKYVYECSADGGGAKRQIVQCLYDSDDGKAYIDAGSEQTVGSYVVKCVKSGLGAHYDRQPVNGQSANSPSPSPSPNPNPSPAAVDTGSNTGGSSDSGSSGSKRQCNIFGNVANVNDKVKYNSFVYQCHENGGYDIVACLDDPSNGGTGAEHPIGDRWTEGTDRPYKYVFECVRKGDGGASKRIAQCFYDSDDGQAKIDVGSSQVVGKNTISCKRSGTNGAIYDLGNPSDTSAKSAISTINSGPTDAVGSPGDSASAGANQCNIFGSVVGVNEKAKYNNLFVYQCRDNGGFDFVACLDDSGNEVQIGNRWTSGGNRPFKYVFQCDKKSDGGPVQRIVQCYYDSDDGQANIDVGSEQVVGKYRVRCKKHGSAGAAYDLQPQ